MNSPQENTFKLSKRVKFFSKLFGQNSAFQISGAKKLGQGAFGTVYASKGAAVKVAHAKGTSQLENEIEILKEVRGSRIAPNLLGSGKGYAAIQKFEGSPLSEYLKKIKNEPIFADYIFRRIVEAAGSLHRKNIAHRDLHAGNIFITDNYEVKIIDYGQAKKGYDIAYFETFFGNNNDPSEGSMGLVNHLFKHTASYKEYKRVLLNSIKNICKKKKLDPAIVLQNYETIEGNEEKESEYFDSLHALSSHPNNDFSDVNLFYNAIDSALRINTKNPATVKKVAPKSSLVSKNTSVTRSINRNSSLKSNVLKFETGGVVPGQGPQTVELHGKELVLPKKAVKLIRKNGKDFSEIAAGTLIAYRIFPHTTEGIEKAKKIIANSEYWVVPSELPDYYDDIDSDIMVGKETPGISAIAEILRAFYKIKSSAGVVDFIDTSKVEDTKIENIVDIKIPPAHYIEGQKARWQPEFESDFDHAVYFAGKSPLPKGAKQREVLEWLLSLNLSYQQIRDHREKVLEKIRETISLPGVDEEYPYVYIDEVEKDFDIENEEEEDYDEFEDDLEGLDDLLNAVRSDDEEPVEKTVTNIEEEILDAAEENDDEEDDPLSDEDLEKILSGDAEEIENIAEKLTDVINKPKRESTYTTNKKIFDAIVSNFGNIQKTLEVINDNLQRQNELIRAAIESQLVVGELISNQTNTLTDKFDLILKQFELQTQISKQQAEDADRELAEKKLESQKDSASVSDFIDTTKNTSTNKRQNRIEQYFRSRLTKKLYRKLPKSIRKARQRVRKLQRLPGRMQSKAVNKISSALPSKGRQAVSSLNKIRGAGGAARMLGPAKYVFAGLEYSERKEAGQTETQALSGVGAGLAGAAAGGVAGAKAGAALGAAIGVWFGGVGAAPGAAIGGILGGLLGSIGGGMAGGNIADRITGAHETGTKLTKPGTAILHGTEAVIKEDEYNKLSPMSNIGGIMISSTAQYINSLGPIASSVAPTFRSIASRMAKDYNLPSTIAQVNAGGSLPNIGKELQKIREKGKKTPEKELSDIEKDLLETQDADSFADKLLKMLDPEGKFQQLLNNINMPGGGAGGQVGAEPFVLLGGSQDPAQAGIDFTLQGDQNRAVLAGTVVEIKHQYNPNATGGDGRQGAGYGNYLVIRSTNPIDGSQVDMLYAHFPKGEIKVKVGDQVSVGQNLGRMATEAEYADPTTRREVGSGTGPHTSLDFFMPGSNQAHPQARQLGDYILTELKKGSQGAIEKARLQAYQTQQTAGALPPGAKPTGVTTNEISRISDTRNPEQLIIGAGHVDTPGRPGSGQGTAFNNVRESTATQHMLRAIQGLVQADPQLRQRIQFRSFNNDNFARDNTNQNTNRNRQFLELHFDQYGGGGRSGLIPSRNARSGITGNTGTSAFDVALSRTFGNYGRDFKRGNLGIPDTGGSILELGAIDSNRKLLEEVRSGTMGPETMKLAQYTYQALRAGAQQEGWLTSVSPPASPQRNRFESLQGDDNDIDTKFLIVNQPQRPDVTLPGGGGFAQLSSGRWKSTVELSSTMRKLYMQRLAQ